MPVNIAQIAAHLGLSRQRVSYVLNGRHDRVSQEVVERVLQASRELGYRPNGVAHALRSNRFHALGLISTTLEHHSFLPGQLLEGLHEATAERNQHLITSRYSDKSLSDPQQNPKILRELLVDGLLINYTHDIPAPLLKLIETAQTPAVWINANLPSNAIRPDDEGSARQLTQRLIAVGHRRILYMSLLHTAQGILESTNHYSIDGRYRGYASAMREAGLAPRLFSLSHWKKPGSPGQFADLIDQIADPVMPTAIVSYSTPGVPALLAAAQARGLRVPDDLTLVAFGDQPLECDGVTIATVILPWGEIGRQAVAQIANMIDDPAHQQVPTLVLPCRFTSGQTCPPLPSELGG